jgi:hypothetical protein
VTCGNNIPFEYSNTDQKKHKGIDIGKIKKFKIKFVEKEKKKVLRVRVIYYNL